MSKTGPATIIIGGLSLGMVSTAIPVIIVSISVLISILLLINYSTVIFNVIDIIIDSVFMAMYFPNLPIYATVIIFTNISFIISIFNKKMLKSKKITNIVGSVILDLFLILYFSIFSLYSQGIQRLLHW